MNDDDGRRVEDIPAIENVEIHYRNSMATFYEIVEGTPVIVGVEYKTAEMR